jgi:hypothetical protein
MTARADQPDREREYREEAERLSLLPRAEQLAVLRIYRECAENPQTPKAEREWGLARVKPLERQLRRLRRGRNG